MYWNFFSCYLFIYIFLRGGRDVFITEVRSDHASTTAAVPLPRIWLKVFVDFTCIFGYFVNGPFWRKKEIFLKWISINFNQIPTIPEIIRSTFRHKKDALMLLSASYLSASYMAINFQHASVRVCFLIVLVVRCMYKSNKKSLYWCKKNRGVSTRLEKKQQRAINTYMQHSSFKGTIILLIFTRMAICNFEPPGNFMTIARSKIGTRGRTCIYCVMATHYLCQ